MRTTEDNVISHLAGHDIHCYGSGELLKFESVMTRYFEREFERWRGNPNPPEYYGVSSFQGNIASTNDCSSLIGHYNKSLDIFQAFLDREYMCYTMGYYGAVDRIPEANDEITLAQAQVAKFELVIERAGIADNQTVLELGCGFGGFAKYLLNKFPNLHITCINPCKVQVDYINKQMKNTVPSFNGRRFNLIEKYFDQLTASDLPTNSFDRVISIGVLEAVTNIDSLFKLVSRVLKPGGKTLHHFIVSADTIPRYLRAEDTLMKNYFPGGHIWPYSEPKRHTEHLEYLDSWFINGMNYWKTLDEWHRRFWRSISDLYPARLSLEEIAEWNKYFVLCKTMFNPHGGRSYGNGQFLFRKDQACLSASP